MTLSNDIFRLDLLKDGTSVYDMIRNSSKTYVEKLEKLDLIYKDPLGNVYLTERGQAAKRIGVEKFVEMERFEKEIEQENSPKQILLNRMFFLTFCSFSLVLTIILTYIILSTS